jgi:hypothetical protein
MAGKTRVEIQDWQATLRQALFEALDSDAVRDVVTALVEKAKKGDIQAARLLLTYAVGTPNVSVKNAVIVNGETAALPTRPARSLPGTTDRLDDYARRARNGQPMFDRRDRTHERDAG